MKNRKGFTIVELVIVIAVIAILAAVLIPTFSGIIGKANASSAQQTATNSLKAGLLMTNTASLPKDTFILIDSDKLTNSNPDYGYIYDGSVLGDPQTLYKNDAFQTGSFIKFANTILVSDKMIKAATEAVGTEGQEGYVAAQPASLDPLLVSMLKAVYNATADGDSVALTEVDGKTVVRVTYGTSKKDFAFYTSVDMPNNVIVFVPMG